MISHDPVARSVSPRPQSRILFLFLCLLPTLLSASSLHLTLSHSFANQPIETSRWYRNASGTQLTLTRLSYFLSDFELVDTNGTATTVPNSTHYADAFQPATHSLQLDISANSYQTLRFKLGLAPELNHSDPNQYPPEHPLSALTHAMHWSWQSGYIFCAIEGYAKNAGSEAQIGFSYHLANDDFLTTIELPLNSDSPHIALHFDLSHLLSGQDFSLAQNTSTHSRPGDPVAQSLAAHLPQAFSLQATDPSEQLLSSAPQAAPTSLVGTPLPFSLPKNFPIPELPTDYPLTEERVALGQALFHSTDLSRDGSLSCVSCHSEANAFSDPRRFSAGIDGTTGRRQSMPLLNLAWKSTFFWDGRAASLREQVLHPIQDPTEMGAELPSVISKLRQDPSMTAHFEAAFGDPEVTAERLGIALESFLLTLTSYQSKFDSAVAGKALLTSQEKRGFELFMTEYDPRRGQYGADCFHCHGSATFSDYLFHNNGLPLTEDNGLAAITGLESDTAKFSTPSLRNVALTAPYMHDGRFRSLEEVIEHYNSGIQNSSTLDPNLAKHPATGLALSEADQAALVAFLETLTDPRFAGPAAAEGAAVE